VADQGVGRKDLLIALPAAQHDFAIPVDRDLTVATTAQLGGAPLADVAAGQPVGEVTWDRDRADPRRTHVRTGTAPIRCSRMGWHAVSQELMPLNGYTDPLVQATHLAVATRAGVPGIVRVYAPRRMVKTAGAEAVAASSIVRARHQPPALARRRPRRAVGRPPHRGDHPPHGQ
jgi:hypothetical protein